MRFLDPRYKIVWQTQAAIFLRSGVSHDDIPGIIDILGPEIVADHLGLTYRKVPSVPSENVGYRVAGVLDRAARRILVSEEFPADQQRLTGMHEVVHWMLHPHVGRDRLHRDRPIGATARHQGQDSVEWEATHVACLALMPEKLLRRVICQLFSVPEGQKLELDERAAFFLGRDLAELREMDTRAQTQLIATTCVFGEPIRPLNRLFKVSPTAMAIRLEELGIIVPPRWRGRPSLRIV